MTTTKKNYPFVTKKMIAEQLKQDEEFRMECMQIIYSRQVDDEREEKNTKYRNGKGFMSSHAKAGTEIVKKMMAGEMSQEDINKMNSIIPRYTKQLAEHFRQLEIKNQPELVEVAKVYGC
jgi:hypothetical protein